MCGIIGFVNFQDAESLARRGLGAISYRGKDATKIISFGRTTFGHNLHSIIDFLPQPLVSGKGALVINCEIYNWKELARRRKIKARNDAELALKMLDKASPKNYSKTVSAFDGDFALAYYSKKHNQILLARDIVGVKPLVYFFDQKTGRVAFASEKKALGEVGLNAVHLNPRKSLLFDLKKGRALETIQKLASERTVSSKALPQLGKLFTLSVRKRLTDKKSALLLSGGLDSSLIAKSLLDADAKFECFFSCISDKAITSEPKDLLFARMTAKLLGKNLDVHKTSVKELEESLPKIINLIESTDPVRVGIAATLYFATRGIAKRKIKVVFSGLGADELFAGYDRFKNSTNINKDCYSYFIKLYENDLYYQDIVCMSNNLELRVPFLDSRLAAFALSLPAKHKIGNSPFGLLNKKILRELAHEKDLPQLLRYRPKKAMQYGSNFDKAIEVLAKKHGYSSKADYLNFVASRSLGGTASRNIPIAALLSTGKDSLYAMQLMQKQGYDVRCLVTVQSSNPDSFMFHTPTTELAKLQARALGKRLILVKTKGEKEKELASLQKGLAVAKHTFGVEGVVSGALFSNYQRERIERVCEQLSLRHFAPLWHHEQASYLKRLVKEGYDVIISKIACYGMNKNWLGQKLDNSSIAELEQLHKKYGINVAGEGGEYESLVLDAPLFKKKLAVSFSKRMQNEFTGEIVLKEAKIVSKR